MFARAAALSLGSGPRSPPAPAPGSARISSLRARRPRGQQQARRTRADPRQGASSSAVSRSVSSLLLARHVRGSRRARARARYAPSESGRCEPQCVLAQDGSLPHGAARGRAGGCRRDQLGERLVGSSCGEGQVPGAQARRRRPRPRAPRGAPAARVRGSAWLAAAASNGWAARTRPPSTTSTPAWTASSRAVDGPRSPTADRPVRSALRATASSSRRTGAGQASPRVSRAGASTVSGTGSSSPGAGRPSAPALRPSSSANNGLPSVESTILPQQLPRQAQASRSASSAELRRG